ncbi:hypothetical protein M433DRAFT_60067 [Acidomyces richmondensis BFW]|nr:MAG: hypothetical protein FE78DRAFT_135572 [Acidomyces sp. 'richmondensis']KYG48925.1 hypothetical protein M433DRAFT_60067 [Acidomyces richmondensis BFW]
MGKKQEMRRVFRQVSLISFTAIIMGTWQWILLANNQALVDGGRGGLFWSYIWTLVGYIFIAASLADMAAMAPTAGGQYHWVSEFSPRKYQQMLSYFSGWFAALCWQAGNCSGLYLCGYIVQALIAIKNQNYGEPTWQGWLLTVALTAFCVVWNIWGEPLLPHMQNLFMPVYVAVCIATIVVMWVLCPHVDAHTALIEVTNTGGWNTMGLALMVGQISSIFALGGSDAAAHMSEEVRHAGLSVPRAMIWSIFINSTIGLVALISFLFACPNINDAVNDPSGFPLVYVLNLAGMPNLTVGLLFLQLLLLMVSNVAYQASTARQTFAFARDGGMPFSRWIGHVNSRYHLPVNAVILTALITIAISLINFGSSIAFNAILSLAAVAQMATYSISITCVLWRRISCPHTLPKSQWTLGHYGIPVNALGAVYSWFSFFWAFWPQATPVDATSMNYSSVMFGGVLVFSLIYYLVKARKSYEGPVTKTEAYLEGAQ